MRKALATVMGLIITSMVAGCAMFNNKKKPEEPKPAAVVEVVEKEEIVTVEVPVTEGTLAPLTGSILQLFKGKQIDDIIGDFQLYMSGRIALERDSLYSMASLSNGKVIIEDVHTRETVTIGDRTPGQAIGYNEENEKIMIWVCFEKQNSENERNYLAFTGKTSDTEGYFYLEYAGAASKLVGEEKGTISYGGKSYRVKYTGDKAPYLSIKVDKKVKDELPKRNVEGRLMVPAGTP